MKRLFKTHPERAVLAAVAFALIASLSWCWFARMEIKRVRATSVGVHLAKTVYQPAEWPAASPRKFEPWMKPSPQSAGTAWVYELFTPPSVFLNQSTGQFVVTPPSDAGKTAPVLGIELIAVRRELFRLQLTGYFGEPEAYTAVFAQPGKPGALFAKEGMSLAGQAITLRKFSVRRELPPDGHGGNASELIAFAEVQDDRTGESVRLSSREPKFSDAPVATVKVNLPVGALREVRTGDVISDGKSLYRISHVTYAPAELVVTCEEPGKSGAESKVLRPVGGETPTVALPSVEPSLIFPRLATGFATPEK